MLASGTILSLFMTTLPFTESVIFKKIRLIVNTSSFLAPFVILLFSFFSSPPPPPPTHPIPFPLRFHVTYVPSSVVLLTFLLSIYSLCLTLNSDSSSSWKYSLSSLLIPLLLHPLNLLYSILCICYLLKQTQCTGIDWYLTT